MSHVILDGFWGPVWVRGGRQGRPEHIPTDINRRKIVLRLALGWTLQRIADNLGMSMKTMRKHYSQQMALRDVALDRIRGARIDVIFDETMKGNMVAVKELGKVIEKIEAATFGMGPAERDEAPARAARIGKKDAAQLAAQDAGAGTDWGNDLLPRIVN